MPLRTSHSKPRPEVPRQPYAPAERAAPLHKPSHPDAASTFRSWVAALETVYGPTSIGVRSMIAGAADSLALSDLVAAERPRDAARMVRSARRGFASALRLADLEARSAAPTTSR